MPFKRFIIIPIFVAAQATTMMMLAPFIPGTPSAIGTGLLAWVGFQAWATYFMAGATPKMGMKTVAGYLGGIVASVVIFELAALFSGMNAGNTPWGLYLAVFIAVIPVIAAEKVPGLDFVPAYFVGAGAFFALMTYVPKPEAVGQLAWYAQVATPIMIACLMGVIYGWITVTVRVAYEKKVAGQ
jgi:hypothetical protein